VPASRSTHEHALTFSSGSQTMGRWIQGMPTVTKIVSLAPTSSHCNLLCTFYASRMQCHSCFPLFHVDITSFLTQ
jgi:hypothetical protein